MNYCGDCGSDDICKECGTCHNCLENFIQDIEKERDSYKKLFLEYKKLYDESIDMIKKYGDLK